MKAGVTPFVLLMGRRGEVDAFAGSRSAATQGVPVFVLGDVVEELMLRPAPVPSDTSPGLRGGAVASWKRPRTPSSGSAVDRAPAPRPRVPATHPRLPATASPVLAAWISAADEQTRGLNAEGRNLLQFWARGVLPCSSAPLGGARTDLGFVTRVVKAIAFVEGQCPDCDKHGHLFGCFEDPARPTVECVRCPAGDQGVMNIVAITQWANFFDLKFNETYE